jgi:transcription termination factor Rho
VAPPRTGKTILLQQIGNAVATNYAAMERPINRLSKSSSNEEFIRMISGTPAVYA